MRRRKSATLLFLRAIACALLHIDLSAGATQPAAASAELRSELQLRIEGIRANVTYDPYNYVELGQVRRISNSFDGFHMSGYFDKSPWSADGSMLLLQRMPQYTKHMSITDAVDIGVVHLHESPSRLEFVGNTTAWNHQQGTMLQWLGWSNSLIVYNARTSGPGGPVAAGGFEGVVYDVVRRQQVAVLPMPVYSLDSFGTVATSLSFARLYVARIDYGYAVDDAAQRRQRAKPCPDDDGVWLMEGIQNPATVVPRLLVSIRKVFAMVASSPANDSYTSLPYGTQTETWNASSVEQECIHWVNHAQLNREGTKVLFLYRVGHCRHFRGWATFPITVDIATGELWRVPLAHGSHHDFGWMENLMSCDSLGYFFAKPKTFTVPLVKPAEVARGADGHCSFAPTSNEFLLSDTYPMKSEQFLVPTRTLFTWDLTRNKVSIIGHYAPVKEGPHGATRVDLHPRWSRDGRYVCWDSTHEGVGRQVYMAKVYSKPLLRAGVDVLTRPPRKYYMDLGARSGDTIDKFLKSKVDGADYIYHAFECNPENMDIIRAALDRMSLQYKVPREQLVLVEAAAWITDGELSFNMDTRPVGADGQPGKTGGSLFSSPHAVGTKVTVPCRDFGAYLEAHVLYADHVVCKLDIEGAEFELLAHLIRSGAVVLCDALYIEWHGRFRAEWAGWEAPLEAMLGRLEIPVIRIG